MKLNKRMPAMFLTVCALLMLLPAQAFAAGNVDLEQEVSLTIHNCYEEEGIPGAAFDLYLVSTVDHNGELKTTSDFADYTEALDIRGENSEAWIQMADTLEQAILSGELGELSPADSAVTGSDGSVSFPSDGNCLTPGLYLVMGSHTEMNGFVYSTSPFFVCLPRRSTEEDAWVYTVEANAKPEQKPLIADLRVMKIWKDDCHKAQRPKSISVQLVCDGEPYGDPVTLPQDGRWEYTWENLEMSHTWTVTEAKVDGYQEGKVQQEGNTFIITNTCDKPSTPSEPSLPQTGQLWWPVSILAAAGLLLIIVGLALRRRNTKHEK
ncbi:MAG: Cna B-type domain-containing protein [Candidatus Onthomonas sp.]